MNLDDTSMFAQIDVQDMRAHIDGLPDQFQSAWELGSQLPLPNWEGIERVIVAGMGGSAIGSDLVAAYIAPYCPVPVVVHRNYSLPAWGAGEGTLVITSSHSGNTEETLTSFETAIENNCRILIQGRRRLNSRYCTRTRAWPSRPRTTSARAARTTASASARRR